MLKVARTRIAADRPVSRLAAIALAAFLTAACGSSVTPAPSSVAASPAPPSVATSAAAASKPAATTSKPAASASGPAAAAASGASGQAAMDQLVAAAKKEGKVVVATSPDESFRKGVLGAFQAKYGIQGENLSDPVATLQNRLVQEKSAGVHSTDVYLTAGAYIPPAYDAGLYAPIKPVIILPDAADPSKWIKGSGAPGPWYMDPKQQDLIRVAASLRYTFNINPDKIDASQIKKPEDLLDPKYKDKITAYDPSIGGIGKPVAALILKTMGDDYFKKLYVGQAPKLAQDDRTIGDWVAKGTYPIGIGLANDEAQRQKAAGFKTAVLKLDSPVSAALASGQYVMGVLVSPPHPNAAKLFVNWMLTQEAMQAIANSDGVATTRTDVDYSKVDPNIIPSPNGTYFDENNWAYVTGEQTALFARIKPLLS